MSLALAADPRVFDRRYPFAELEPVEGPQNVRLICMGHDLQDNKTLEGQSRTRIGIELEADLARSADSRVPVFAHPTPVNVAIRPKDVPAPKSKGGVWKVSSCV